MTLRRWELDARRDMAACLDSTRRGDRVCSKRELALGLNAVELWVKNIARPSELRVVIELGSKVFM